MGFMDWVINAGNDFSKFVDGGGKAVEGLFGDLGYLPQQVDPEAPGSSIDTSHADADRDRLNALLQQLQQQAATGGGAWEQTFKDATAQANANAQSLSQATPGTGYQSGLMKMGDAQGAVAQRAVGEESMLRDQSKLDAQDSISSLLGGMGAQDIDQANEQARAKRNVRAANQALLEQAKNAREGTQKGIAQILPAMSEGGAVPGHPQVFGDDERNDTVPAKLSPGEIVIPRSIAESPDAAERSADFVRAIQSQRGGDGVHFADGGSTGIKGTSVQDYGGPENVALSILVPHIGQAQGEKALEKATGTGVQPASLENGSIIDTSKYDQTRASADAQQALLMARANGTGPSVAPEMLQRAGDQSIGAALQAAQSGRGAPAGDILQALAQHGAGTAADAGRQSAVEQSLGQRGAASFGMGQRALEMKLAGAQQAAGWENTMMNAGLTLANQASLRNTAGQGGQGAAVIAGAGRGEGDKYVGPYASDYYGDRGGPADLGASEPDFGEWENPYGKAHGGEIGVDEDEARRAREFIDSLRSAA